MEAKLKSLLGEMSFTIVMLQTQLEAARKEIDEMKKAEPTPEE